MTLVKVFIIILFWGSMLSATDEKIIENVWDGLYLHPVLSKDSANALGDYFDEAAFLSLGQSVWSAAFSEGYQGDIKKASSDFEKITALNCSKIQGPSLLFLTLCRAYRHGGTFLNISEIDVSYMPLKHFVHLYVNRDDLKGWETFSKDLDIMPIEYSAIVIGMVPVNYQELATLYARKLEKKTDGESSSSLRESLKILNYGAVPRKTEPKGTHSP